MQQTLKLTDISTALEVGDLIAVTVGPDLYKGEGGSFTVGPFSVQTQVRPGEDAEAAYLRARKVLGVFMQADYTLAAKHFEDRSRELKK